MTLPALPPVRLSRRAARALAAFCAGWALLAAPVHAGTPSDVRIGNVTDRQVSVSWVTSAAETGYLRWGVDPANLAARAEDDRGAVASTTHHVTIGNLTPRTAYYVDLASGSTVDNNGGAHYRVTTGPALDPGSPAPPVYGQLSRPDGASPAGILIYATVRDGDGRGTPGASGLLSSIVQEKDQGYWYLNLGLARLADLSGPFSYSASGDKLALRLVGGPGQALELTLDTGAAAPAAPITLPAPPPSATATPRATATQIGATPTPTPPAATATVTPVPPTLPAATATAQAPRPSATPPSAVVSPVATVPGSPAPTGAPATPLVTATGVPGIPSPTPPLTATPALAPSTPTVASPAPAPSAPPAAGTAAATPAIPAAPGPGLPEWLPVLLGAGPVLAALLYLAARRARRP